jgi:hypothetical protein
LREKYLKRCWRALEWPLATRALANQLTEQPCERSLILALVHDPHVLVITGPMRSVFCCHNELFINLALCGPATVRNNGPGRILCRLFGWAAALALACRFLADASSGSFVHFWCAAECRALQSLDGFIHIHQTAAGRLDQNAQGSGHGQTMLLG